MVRGQKKQVLSVQEIENIKEEKKELEATLKEAEGYGEGTGRSLNTGVIKGQIKRFDQVIHESTAPRVSGMQKDAMAKRAKELEDKFEAGMPTRYEMDHPARCPGAVRKHMKWLDRNEKPGAIEEYRQIQRVLNPGEELSVERLRKDK